VIVDQLDLQKARDTQIRLAWIRVMEMKLVRHKLRRCYKVEGVNHRENCKEVAEKYLSMLKDPRYRVTGYIGLESIDYDN
jgi:NADH dehydrogenase (ubiquinone) 1 beta subcomplex subunit 10